MSTHNGDGSSLCAFSVALILLIMLIFGRFMSNEECLLTQLVSSLLIVNQ